MRLVAATVYGTIGGSTKVLLAAAHALRREHDVVVRAPLREADSETPSAVSSRSLETWRDKFAVLPSLMRAIAREFGWIRNCRPDAIYVHDELSLYVYGAIAWLLRIPVVWHVHMREGQGVVRYLRDGLCDAKIFVSRFIIRPDQRRPWVLIRNCVSVAVTGSRRPESTLRLGMLGSISVQKNQELALRVMAHLRGDGVAARLMIFGGTIDESYADKILQQIASYGLSEVVTLRGFVPVEQALSEIDVLLSCSVYESFGLAIVEALACGIPVIASDIPAHREIAGILRTPALTLVPLDSAAFANAGQIAKPDQNAPRRVETEFGMDRFAAELTTHLPQLLRTSAPGELQSVRAKA